MQSSAPRRPRTRWSAPLLLVLAAAARLAGAEDATLPEAPTVDEPPGVFVRGVADRFDATRAAIAAAKRTSGRDYRVIVVDESGAAGDASGVLEQVTARWREGSDPEGGGFNPAADVTIVLDEGGRRLAMDVPWSLEASAGLDRATLEAQLIERLFVPRGKDGLFDEGLAALVAGTEEWVRVREDEALRRAAAARTFRTRTLPLGLASLAGAGVLGAVALQWSRHARKLRAARAKLAAFKQEVVDLSDLLDAQQERHRMLPHSDPDFRTTMQGLTRHAYDGVQEAIRRHRERWLALMDVWERAQERIAGERFLGTRSAEEAIRLIDSAAARQPLEEVAGECRGPLDALEHAHEQARELAAKAEAEGQRVTARLEALGRRGRSAAPFQAAQAEVIRVRARAGDIVEPDPVAARGMLEEALAALGRTDTALEALEAADDRRSQAVERTAEVRARVAARRAEGWLLTEPGADPDDRLAAADREVELAAQLLDAGDTAAALEHLDAAEQARAYAVALVESVEEARGRVAELLPAAAARLEALAARRPAVVAELDALAAYARAAWSDVADNVAGADEGLERARTLILEARAAADPARQHFLRGLALVEEAGRQLDWVEGSLTAIVDRRAELDALRTALPGRRDRVADRVATLHRGLTRQRTDRVRANERCREAGRLLEIADDQLATPQPDVLQAARLLEAADTAAARGEEFAAEDERLARQAESDLDETDALVRRVAAWYAEGVQPDVRAATAALETARSLLGRQRYEDAIRAAAEAADLARTGYAAATAEAERRRVRRYQEIQRRTLEESFSRMSRGTGPWTVRLPGGTLTGPDPWRALRPPAAPARPSAGTSWSRDIAQVGW